MEIAREVQVDVLHRKHLGVTTPGGASLHPEAGPQGRFPQSYNGFLSYFVQTQCQTDRNGRFPDTGLVGCDGRDQNQMMFLDSFLIDFRTVDFGHIMPVRMCLFKVYAQIPGNLIDFFQRGFPCDFNIWFHFSLL